MFTATVINFLLASLNTGTEVALFTMFIRKILIPDIDYPLSERRELVDQTLQNMSIVTNWTAYLPVLFSDLVVIWRAWVLFPERQWIILIPFILWIGATGIFVGGLIWISIPNDYNQWGSKVDISLMTAGTALSIATNAITTMMIAYKLWNYRTFIVKTLGRNRRKSQVQMVLIHLVESGLVYLGIQIVFLVLTADVSALEVEAYAIQTVFFSLSAMYPTVMIILVETQRSMADVWEISHGTQVNSCVNGGRGPARLKLRMGWPGKEGGGFVCGGVGGGSDV